MNGALSLVQSQSPWHCLLSAIAESSWWGCHAHVGSGGILSEAVMSQWGLSEQHCLSYDSNPGEITQAWNAGECQRNTMVPCKQKQRT